MTERIIEQDGKRWRFVGRRVPRFNEYCLYEGRIVITTNFRCEATYDIYEPIEEKPMLRHVIAGHAPDADKVIKWSLVKIDDVLHLKASEEGGNSYYVFSIRADGTAYRTASVPSSLGLRVDDKMRIKLAE